MKENRLYFKDNILIRYIDENGDIYDLYENLETCSLFEFVLSESYELLENINENKRDCSTVEEMLSGGSHLP